MIPEAAVGLGQEFSKAFVPFEAKRFVLWHLLIRLTLQFQLQITLRVGSKRHVSCSTKSHPCMQPNDFRGVGCSMSDSNPLAGLMLCSESEAP